MTATPFCRTAMVREPHRTAVSSPFVSLPMAPALLPALDPKRPHFSENPVAFVDCGRSKHDGGRTTNIRLTGTATDIFEKWDFSPLSDTDNPLLDGFGNTCRRSSGDFCYEVDVPSDGLYDVTLVFCETEHHAKGKRVMSLEVEGVQKYVKWGLDVFDEVGALRTFVLCFDGVQVKTTLKIRFLKGYDGNPFVSGFVVVPSDKQRSNILVSPATVALVDCGNSDGYDAGLQSHIKRLSKDDRNSRTSSTIVSENPAIADMSKSCRWSKSDFEYEITVPEPGRYEVNVLFCESYAPCFAKGIRTAGLQVEGLDNYERNELDIFAEAGANCTLLMTCPAVRVDKVVKIRILKGLRENPIVSGIMVSRTIAPQLNHTLHNLPAVIVDCGNVAGNPGHDSGICKNVEFLGQTSTAIRTGFTIVSEDALLSSMGKSMRSSATELEYKIQFKQSDQSMYDVAVVFCEIDSACFGVGKRVITLEVNNGKQLQTKEKIDIYEQVGAYRTLVIRFQDVAVTQGSLSIQVKSAGAGKAAISGFIVAASESAIPQMKASPLVAFVKTGMPGASRVTNAGAGSNVRQVGDQGATWEAVYHVSGNPLLAGLCSTHRYAGSSLEYEVTVGQPGKYDVAVFFAEVFQLGLKLRIFNVEITGTEKIEEKELNVFAQAGGFRPLVLQFMGVEVDKVLKIRCTKGSVENVFMSGFIVYPSGVANRLPMPGFTANTLYNVAHKCDRCALPGIIPASTLLGDADLNGKPPLPKAPPARLPVAPPASSIIIDCGVDTPDSRGSNIVLEDSTQSTGEPVSIEVSIDESIKTTDEQDEQWRQLGSSYRTSEGAFGYKILSLNPGTYDVTVLYGDNEWRRFSIGLKGTEEAEPIVVTTSGENEDVMLVKAESHKIHVESSLTILLEPEIGDPVVSGIIVTPQ